MNITRRAWEMLRPLANENESGLALIEWILSVIEAVWYFLAMSAMILSLTFATIALFSIFATAIG